MQVERNLRPVRQTKQRLVNNKIFSVHKILTKGICLCPKKLSSIKNNQLNWFVYRGVGILLSVTSEIVSASKQIVIFAISLYN